ncbi:hypothetical protein BO71DRAFT_489001 [Aspergillus ellipticus CBS 707.79]|uniref:Protein kinase domain-containing protein n=1 Tax=Aspergillus ellipticus CBS 707.79 TaxID=1448320 RepID=A0A319DJ51_9EURO|nr:hypothetical protein BO71DRAFT_489001 [Aspergillus ellipticus CBS 707.79]
MSLPYECPKPLVPYVKGQTLSRANREARRNLTPVESCLQNPPLPGRLEASTLLLEIRDTIRVGDGHNAQVFTVQAQANQELVPREEVLVAKVYDPLYFEDDGGLFDPFLCMDRYYTHEAEAYKMLAEYQGGLIPKFYGTFSLEIPVDGAEARIVRLILIEYIPGWSMQQATPSDFPRPVRQQMMKSVVELESDVYGRDIRLSDLSPQNVMIARFDSHPERKLVFIDLAGAVLGRVPADILAMGIELFQGQYISPLLGWKRSTPYEFNDWIDWEWEAWIMTEFTYTEASITPEIRAAYDW